MASYLRFTRFRTQKDTTFVKLGRFSGCGGTADYYGSTYDRIETEMGVFWPHPELGHPETPHLLEDLKFYKEDGKAHFNAVSYRLSAEEPNDDYPVILTTGRVVSQYLRGTQTRRIGGLVDICPDPYVEIHPLSASRHGIADGGWRKVESGRGDVTMRAKVVTTFRPDTIFIPYQ